MRFTPCPAIFVLAAAAWTALADGSCAVCPQLRPGVSEIAWSLVWNRTVAENEMFCAFRGHGRGNPIPAQTFCMYTNDNGTLIPNDMSLQACPTTVSVVTCPY